MKSLRVLLCLAPLTLTGCSTLSNVQWSSALPWNWFGSSDEVTEQGVGKLTAQTPLNDAAISDALGSDYRLRSGMKSEGGNIVRYYEVMNGDAVAMVINGESGTVSRIDVLDNRIATQAGVKTGMPFSDLFDKAYGHCQKASGDDSTGVECKATESQHISYIFTGNWNGPQDLMPSDDALKNWKIEKIIWRR